MKIEPAANVEMVRVVKLLPARLAAKFERMPSLNPGNKVGKLTEDDWAMIRRHPVTGADLVIKMSGPDKVGHWIRDHHERPAGEAHPGADRGAVAALFAA
ncbi:hypothetical protein B4Q13_15770 [Lacticaseibacillus rhamnosus]